MSKHKNLKRNLLICLLAGSAVMYTLPLHAATSVIGNNTLPTGENSLTHNHTFDRGNLEMTITQIGSNGIIKWDSFDVGGSATVNFRGDLAVIMYLTMLMVLMLRRFTVLLTLITTAIFLSLTRRACKSATVHRLMLAVYMYQTKI